MTWVTKLGCKSLNWGASHLQPPSFWPLAFTTYRRLDDIQNVRSMIHVCIAMYCSSKDTNLVSCCGIMITLDTPSNPCLRLCVLLQRCEILRPKNGRYIIWHVMAFQKRGNMSIRWKQTQPNIKLPGILHLIITSLYSHSGCFFSYFYSLKRSIVSLEIARQRLSKPRWIWDAPVTWSMIWTLEREEHVGILYMILHMIIYMIRYMIICMYVYIYIYTHGIVYVDICRCIQIELLYFFKMVDLENQSV